MQKRKKKREGLYCALVAIPDYLYPFKTQVQGQWVRGIRAYRAIDAKYERKYGIGHYGVKLDAYRQVFHLVGSILFLSLAAYISGSVLENDGALYLFLGIAIAFITFQEFYLHRRMYRQLWRKGIVDWLAWCLPMGIYFFTHFR